MGKLLLLAMVLLCCGCGGHRGDVALICANGYEAAKAAQSGANLQATLTAVRLAFAKIAVMHGYAIEGAQDWEKSLKGSKP